MQMRISTKVQYGLRAAVYLAQNAKAGKVISAKEISDAENIPAEYLEKIITKLEKSGVVESKKGVAGGYFLARSAAKIKVGEIFGALESQATKVRCLDAKCPRQGDCATRHLWHNMQAAINKFLQSVTLKDLINNKIR